MINKSLSLLQVGKLCLSFKKQTYISRGALFLCSLEDLYMAQGEVFQTRILFVSLLLN